MNREQRRTAYSAIAIWAAVSLLDAVVLRVDAGGSLWAALKYRASEYGILALLGIAVWHLVQRWSSGDWPRWRLIGAHGGLAVTVVVLWQVGNAVFFYVCGGRDAIENLLGQVLWVWLQAGVTYGLLLSSILYVQAARRIRRQAAREASLRLLAREAEVRALRAQLRPHFLFNVLNSIYAFIGSAPAKAENMVALLADLLRDTLELGDQPLISLEQEITLARRYLAIESVRLGERLSIDIEVASTLHDALIPPFLLQPLVENAIIHGIAPSTHAGRLTIEARRLAAGDTFQLRIHNRGGGAAYDPARAGDDTGRGLTITRARLEAVYGSKFAWSIGPTDEGGCEVLLRLPMRPVATDLAPHSRST